MVGSGESSSHLISAVSRVARIFSVHLSRAPRRSTEASLLFPVIGSDQDTAQEVMERSDHYGRSTALQPSISRDVRQPTCQKRLPPDPPQINGTVASDMSNGAAKPTK